MIRIKFVLLLFILTKINLSSQSNQLLAFNSGSRLDNESNHSSSEADVQTTSSNSVKLSIQRSGSEVVCNVSNPLFIHIKKLIIERKSSSPLSNFTGIKTLNSSELEKVNITGQVIINDKFPESRKLDSYYRIKYEDKSGEWIILPEVYLESNSTSSTEILVDEVSNESLFVNSEDTIRYFSDDFGLKILAEPQGTSVFIKLENVGFKYNPTGRWYIERKADNLLAAYKLIKPLSENDIQKLMNDGNFVFNDVYPESRKTDAYYRLRYEDQMMDFELLFEPVIVEGIRAK